ncbi:hypothetical protein C3K47_18685 [Solitalea longa]|uniref:Outer membrane protein beta-barrel domain-containing protein n=1 Tax=Solitalea longa TaxID=2079460 RepID=A0A2S4ZWL7_9SPHI|nr:hypothetical protein [Solitalea longa]POY34761.1 hypothetical protein C3K47_18685 [Solitalea longa]
MTKYFPTPVQTPLLSEKNELKITASVPGDISVAYAPGQNIGIFTSVSFYNEIQESSSSLKGTLDEYKKTGNHLVFEAGVGYFKKLEPNFLFEIYGGFGLGRFNIESEYNNDPVNYEYKIPTSKFFVNPSFGIKRKHVEIAFSMRLTALNFGKSSTNFNTEMIDTDELENLDTRTYFFYEPSFTIRAGFEPIKFHYQVGYSHKFGSSYLNYLPFFNTVGITVDITPKLFKKNKGN